MIHTLFFKNLAVSHTFQPKPDPGFLDIESRDDNLDLLNDLPALGLAIVGSRLPQRRSCEHLERVMADLRGSGLIILSGLARGIDSRSHELALEHGLKTIAVLGCGIDVDYPRENRHLRRRIVEAGGLIISQFPRGTAPLKGNFLNRNQLIAGFAKAVWVVEAAAISGTLNTAKHASSFNRDLYATSCFPGDPIFEGNERLISEQRTDRYPVARPLFNAQSLAPTWSDLGNPAPGPSALKPETLLQQWVIELQGEYGECPVQALMNHAYGQGLTLGKFYLQYEKELEQGKLAQDADGRVSLRPNRRA